MNATVTSEEVTKDEGHCQDVTEGSLMLSHLYSHYAEDSSVQC